MVVLYVVMGLVVALAIGSGVVYRYCCYEKHVPLASKRSRQSYVPRDDVVVVEACARRPPAIGVPAVVKGLQQLLDREVQVGQVAPFVIAADDPARDTQNNEYLLVAVQGYSSRPDALMLRECATAAREAGKHPIEVNIKPSMDALPLLRTMGAMVDVDDQASRETAKAILLAIT